MRGLQRDDGELGGLGVLVPHASGHVLEGMGRLVLLFYLCMSVLVLLSFSLRGMVRLGFSRGRQAARQPGSQTARQPGSQAARQPGSQAARQPGSQAARQPGSQAARQPGSQATRQPGIRMPTQALACDACIGSRLALGGPFLSNAHRLTGERYRSGIDRNRPVQPP